MALPRPSKKAFPRKKRRPSRRNSRMPARPSKLSKKAQDRRAESLACNLFRTLEFWLGCRRAHSASRFPNLPLARTLPKGVHSFWRDSSDFSWDLESVSGNGYFAALKQRCTTDRPFYSGASKVHSDRNQRITACYRLRGHLSRRGLLPSAHRSSRHLGCRLHFLRPT